MSERWRGEDGHGQQTLSWGAVALAAIASVIAVLAGAWIVEVVIIVVLSMIVTMVGLPLLAHLLHAQVTLDGNTVELRHTFGLRRVSIAVPCAIEIGELTQSSFKSWTSNRGDLTRATGAAIGTYVRFGDRITVSCWLKKYDDVWDKMTPGPSRNVCDVELEPEDFLALAKAITRRAGEPAAPRTAYSTDPSR